ncbi:putative conidiation-specific protein [Talaromyces proteolyticus]|uniref:Conidiation-specific protein n=1 Tax=Talaromyces proteolyticus TaxID=1131652 RepID=A0AAD4PX62_9EURO|nr:putative conidiation-specific protein [Talaromyces proteolyticus]KAH8692279.1 putative conidiation-specific protein [Talaromyces proteolyticus]
MASSLLLCIALMAAGPLLALAQTLDKPALTPDLDYLEQGAIDNLAPTQSTNDQWGSGWIPSDCKDIANNEGKNPDDFEIYNVHYDDCDDAWVFCRHKDTPTDLITTIDIFGRLPVAMRSWVRHVLTIPGDNYAYNSNGNIAFFGTTSGIMDVAIHETGHSLDLLGAYGDQLSSSQDWLDNYNQDSNVPDNYAQTNQIENVEQNTVVSVYDKVVPGGFGSAQPNWNNIFHQYATLQGKAGDQIIPGGSCDRHLVNSETVSTSDSAAAAMVDAVDKPVTSFKGNYTKILKTHAKFNTKESCYFGN